MGVGKEAAPLERVQAASSTIMLPDDAAGPRHRWNDEG